MTKKDELSRVSAAQPHLLEVSPIADIIVLASKATAQLPPYEYFSQLGFSPRFAITLEEATALLDLSTPDIIFIPPSVEGESSMPLLKKCQSLANPPHVVVIASNDQINEAADAMRLGAFDCLFHPFSAKRLEQVIAKAMGSTPIVNSTKNLNQQIDLKEKPPTPPIEVAPKTETSNGTPMTAQPISAPSQHPKLQDRQIIGNHPLIRNIINNLRDLAQSTAPVFLHGEVGTEKELLARTLHKGSGRAPNRFVVVDCATLRPETVASEIFGHMAGAFPGALQNKPGAAQQAHGGTIYFDEIANLDLRSQSQLVRFLRSDTIHPLGAEQPENVDVRIISCSSHDLTDLIQKEKFLKDLYYQLHVAPIELPPLRERGDDIVLLAEQWLRDYSHYENRQLTRLSPESKTLLQQYNWPGNMQELKNIIWNAVLHHDGVELMAHMLPPHLQSEQISPTEHAAGSTLLSQQLIGLSLAEIEQIVIEDTIRAHGGSVPRAAKVLGISPSTIYRKRESWAAEPPSTIQ